MLLWSTSMFLWGACSSSSSASSSTSSSSSSSSSAAQQFSSSFSGSEINSKMYQNWEESLRVSENNMQDIQRPLRCRVCARWGGHMYNILLAFNILAT